ncbi:MAG: hypothetical protein OXH49_00810 [Gemmatimonadetes bacterium]|nr:hypothetical protein [Gemmatimonadota bacterium]
MLRELAQIHLEIDAPTRKAGTQEPDWIFRLRKVCLHALASSQWELDVAGVHVMAPELRAAYEQMDAVWKCLPEEFRFDRIDGNWWADEGGGLLAAFDHPTPMGLTFPLAQGGFDEVEDPRIYPQVAVWACWLGIGYGFALIYLAQVLGTKGDIESRVITVLNVASGEPS